MSQVKIDGSIQVSGDSQTTGAGSKIWLNFATVIN